MLVLYPIVVVENPQHPSPSTSSSHHNPASAGAETVVDALTVVGRRGRAELEPENEFDEVEIDRLGAEDVGAVVARVNQSVGGQGAPIVIVNGRRLAMPDVFYRFAPESLTRVEVLPPSASAVYADGDPSRRVLNIVLQKRFESVDAMTSIAKPSGGGTSTSILGAGQSRIVDIDTDHADFRFSRDTSLRGSERSSYLASHPSNDKVTLRPDARMLSINLSMTKAFGTWGGSVNLQGQQQDIRFSAFGAGGDARSHSRNQSLTAVGGLAGEIGGWSTRSSLAIVASRSNIIANAPVQVSSRSADLSLAASKSILKLEAGSAAATLSARLARTRTQSREVDRRRTLDGRVTDFGVDLSIPISRSGSQRQAGSHVGDLVLALGARRRFTDAGSGENLSAGLFWAPIRGLNFNGRFSVSLDAPGSAQRFGPSYYGPTTTIFDLRTGQSVTLSPLVGGNPELRSTWRTGLSLGASTAPITAWRVFANVNFRRQRASNEIGALPPPVEPFETVFADRFKRDQAGRLVGIDQRPINLASTRAQTLTSALSFAVPTEEHGANSGDLQVTLSHSWQLLDSSLIRTGLPRLDRLAGDGGGVPRHTIQVQLDGHWGSWGLKGGLDWKSKRRDRRDSGRDGPGDLVVGTLTKAEVKLSHTWRANRSSRPDDDAPQPVRPGTLIMTLEVTNLLDARPRARLGDGRSAPGYARDDQDPIGRLARVSLSARF